MLNRRTEGQREHLAGQPPLPVERTRARLVARVTRRIGGLQRAKCPAGGPRKGSRGNALLGLSEGWLHGNAGAPVHERSLSRARVSATAEE